ncbi:MAG TPA: hypothetical protein VFX70_20895 [Mycobacteriales bacterium]|nr:hypothetical protein [Mycobacteriales bacterium]
MKRFLLAGVAVVLALLPTTAAWADSVDDATSALRGNKVYLAPDASMTVDAGTVRKAIGDHELRVAVLAGGAGDPAAAATRIGKALGGSRTVAVISGNEIGAASNFFCAGAAQTAISGAARAHQSDLNGGNATSTLVDLVSRLGSAPQVGRNCGRPAAAPAGQSGGNGGGSAVPWVIGIGVLAAGGGGLYLASRRRKNARLLEGRRAEVLSLYDRLGADVQNLDAAEDKVARQALADAAERYTATGSLLSKADTVGEYEAARRTALEGLYAARTARTALGLDPGPDLPSLTPSVTDRLTEEREVTVEGRTYRGYPEYTPGAPYYYGGGGGYASGWYSSPFWETLLIGSVLTGGLGGFGGGGFESGYDRGFDAGFDQGQNDSGGGWGGGGGGDWGGGGGGDWGGGGGGGGDW